jgi:hypothetical protein
VIGLISVNWQEKYFGELSITPVGYFTGAIKNHSRAVSHRNYFAWRKWFISDEQELFSQGLLYIRCNLIFFFFFFFGRDRPLPSNILRAFSGASVIVPVSWPSLKVTWKALCTWTSTFGNEHYISQQGGNMWLEWHLTWICLISCSIVSPLLPQPTGHHPWRNSLDLLGWKWRYWTFWCHISQNDCWWLHNTCQVLPSIYVWWLWAKCHP